MQVYSPGVGGHIFRQLILEDKTEVDPEIEEGGGHGMEIGVRVCVEHSILGESRGKPSWKILKFIYTLGQVN